MIEQKFRIINGTYVSSLGRWISNNLGTVKSIKIAYPTGNDKFYDDLSIVSEVEGSIKLGGLDGIITFTFVDDKTLKIAFYGALPLKSGCYKEKEINLRSVDEFDTAVDEITDVAKAYIEENEEAESEDVSDEPF